MSAKITQTYFEEVSKRVPVLNSTESQEPDQDHETSNSAESDTETGDKDSDENQENDSEDTSTDSTEEEQQEETEKSTNTTSGEDLKMEMTDSNNNTIILDKEPEYRTIIEHVAKNRTFTKKLFYEEEFITHQPLTTEQKVNAAAHLVNLEKRDKLILDTMKAKNDYEALIYSSREWISEEDNQVYTTPETVEQFLKELSEGEDWLYEDGYDEKLEVYIERTQKLNSTYNPIRFRHSEHRVREEVVEPAKKYLANITEEINALHKQFPWIESFKIDRLKEMAYNATEWFNTTAAEQEKLQLHEDPVLSSEEIRDKVITLGKIMQMLSRTPKPKDWDKDGKKKKKDGLDINDIIKGAGDNIKFENVKIDDVVINSNDTEEVITDSEQTSKNHKEDVMDSDEHENLHNSEEFEKHENLENNNEESTEDL